MMTCSYCTGGDDLEDSQLKGQNASKEKYLHNVYAPLKLPVLTLASLTVVERSLPSPKFKTAQIN